jgi:hypothetical protein
MVFEKNLTQDEFLKFYNAYVHRMSKPLLAAWLIRLIPENDLKNLLKDL